jgi:hypothetical protein
MTMKLEIQDASGWVNLDGKTSNNYGYVIIC